MPDETSKSGGFEPIRILINLVALVMAAGIVALIVAAITTGG
jgi:hypothetical protein